VDFEVVLYRDGRIGMNYAAEHTGLDTAPTIGLSGGNGADYLLSSLNGSSSIPAGTGVLFTPLAAALPAGLALDSSSGEISGTPAAAGDYAFAVGLTDSYSSPSLTVKTFSLHVRGNVAPVAVMDSYLGLQNQTLVVGADAGVLANDTDADGDELTVTKVSDTSHGALTLNSDGSFTYVPDAGYWGNDSFTYKASDLADVSNTVTAWITLKQSRTVTFDLGGHGTRTGGGELVQVVAVGGSATAPEFTVDVGWEFTGWDKSFSAVTADITVTALYNALPFALTVDNGTGSGSYVMGTVVPIVADAAPEGQVFARWSASPSEYTANLDDPSSSSTNFTMPTSAVTLTAIYDDPPWSVELALAGGLPATLTFGMDLEATDGYDSGLDELTDTTGSYLASAGLGTAYATDWHETEPTGEFLLVAAAGETALTVSWAPPTLPAGKYLSLYEVVESAPDRGAVTFERVGNTALDMAATRQLEVPAGETRTYVILYGDEVVFDLLLKRGWNLVSLPVEPTLPLIADLFVSAEPDSIEMDGVLTWQSGGYLAVTEMHACVGYWVYSTTSQVVLVAGTPVEQDSLSLAASLNMVGVKVGCMLPADERILGRIWQWDATLCRYVDATELLPGCGYWVTASTTAVVPLAAR
jgi:hypothetical protein